MIDENLKNNINNSFIGILEAHKNMYLILNDKKKDNYRFLESEIYVFTKNSNYYIIIKSSFTEKQFQKRFTMLIENGYDLITLFISIDFKSVDYEYIKNFKLIK